MRERVCGNCRYLEHSHHPDHRCIGFDALCICGHGESIHGDGGCSATLKEGFCSCPGFMSYYPLKGRADFCTCGDEVDRKCSVHSHLPEGTYFDDNKNPMCCDCEHPLSIHMNEGFSCHISCTECIQADTVKEAVNHPNHYQALNDPDGNYEVIKVLAAWLTFEEMRGFCIGNAIKYIGRAGKKGNAIEDFSKARWYLDYAINMGDKF